MFTQTNISFILTVLSFIAGTITIFFGKYEYKTIVLITIICYAVTIISFIVGINFYKKSKNKTSPTNPKNEITVTPPNPLSENDRIEKLKKAINFFNKSEEKFNPKDYDEALVFAQEALRLYDELGETYNIGKAECHTRIAMIYCQKNDALAIENFNEAINIYKALDDKPKQADIYAYIGYFYFMKILYSQDVEISCEKAVFNYENALNIYKKLDNKKLQAEIHLKISDCYKGVGDEKCLDYYKKALDLYILLEDKEGKARVYTYIGDYHCLKDNDKALFNYKKALDTTNGKWNKKNYLCIRIAGIYNYMGKEDEAKKYSAMISDD